MPVNQMFEVTLRNVQGFAATTVVPAPSAWEAKELAARRLPELRVETVIPYRDALQVRINQFGARDRMQARREGVALSMTTR